MYKYYNILYSKEELRADANVRQLIADQTTQWTEMIERHKKEEWDMLKTQLEDQKEVLKKLLEQTQAAQIKQLEAKHER